MEDPPPPAPTPSAPEQPAPPSGAVADAAPGRRAPPARLARSALRWMRAPTETRVLVALALVVRLAAAWSSPALVNDSVSLLRAAAEVSSTGAAALLGVPHHPLPPALYALTGLLVAPELGATLVNAIAGSLAVWPLHSLARRACGRHAALATCLLYVALPKAVDVAAVPLAEGPFLPFFLGSLALAAAARDAGPRTRRRLIGAGLLAALAYLCRPEGLVAAPVLVAAAALDGRPGRLRRAAFVLVGFLPLALGYAGLLSAQRGAPTLTPKKDVARFVGAASPRIGEPTAPPPVTAPDGADDVQQAGGDVVRGVARALDSALTLPVAVLALVGLLLPGRWMRRRARRPRLLVAGTAFLLIALLARLQAGWGYAGGRHAIAAATLLLVFAGHGLTTFGGLLPRMSSRRRMTYVVALLLAIPLGCRAILRPPGEGGAAARRLGERIAQREPGSATLRIASSAEPVVAYYAERTRGAPAVDVPLWGRFVRPLERGAPGDEVADALARELRDGADWVVLDVAPPAAGEPPSATRRLAEALRERGVLGAPALAAGSSLAAYPVVR